MAALNRRTMTSIGARAHTDQRGAISNWFVQILIVIAVVGLIIYEAVALGFTTVRVDDLAREVAREARDEYRSEQSLDSARARAEELAADREATVVRVDVDGDVLTVTLEMDANTLLVHRIPPLADRLTPTATRRADLRP
jgi:hypothetical protein